VNFDADTRRVVLGGGQAFFEVAHDRNRPFTVIAGNAEISVTGTKFDVRWVGDHVQVAVLEGRVELRRRPLISQLRAEVPERVLTKGQQSELLPERGFAPPQSVAIAPGDWRAGRFYYLDAPLSEVLADASRYSATPIRAANAEVANMRVTMSFESSDVQNLLGNLEEILPVDTQQQADGSTVIVGR
jgi:transmembrane sensor